MFLKKATAAKRHAEEEKRRYWRIRNAVIDYLGGECHHCHSTDHTNFEIHHLEPTLCGGYKNVVGGGAAILREWKRILRGEVKARLCCKDCHRYIEHNGNPCELKERKNHE